MRYKLTISYDGAYFYGFQRQKDLISVQEEIEKALSIIMKEPITINGSGRTDSGVHAIGQVIDFKTNQNVPPKNLIKIMNKRLYPHIYVKDSCIVDDRFHSRIYATKKEYHYKVSLNTFDPLQSNYIYFFHDRINISNIRKAMSLLIGEHDFRSFAKTKEEDNTIRTIESFDLDINDGVLTFKIIGNGFMRNMVRIIVAVMLRVGEGKLTVDDVKKILDAKSRDAAPWVAPSQGLYLYKVHYE